MLGIAIVIGRLSAGWLLDHFPPPYVGMGIFALGATGAAAFVLGGAPFAVPTVVALGFLIGAEIDILSFVTLR